MAIVYQHRRLDNNEIFYVGIGDSEERAYQKLSRNRYWWNIVKKTSYAVEIVHSNLSWELACEKERELIKKYGRSDLKEGSLVNMTSGGDGVLGLRHSEEYKNRLRLNGPMKNPKVVEKWKQTNGSKSQEEKEHIKKRILDSVFGNYTKEEIRERYKEMSKKMKGIKRPNTSQTMKGKPKQKIKCDKCGISMSKNHMTRFHKLKCK